MVGEALGFWQELHYIASAVVTDHFGGSPAVYFVAGEVFNITGCGASD